MLAVLGTLTRYHSQVEGHLFHIPEVPNSNLGPESRYPEVLHGFVDFPYTNTSLIPVIRPQPIPHACLFIT